MNPSSSGPACVMLSVVTLLSLGCGSSRQLQSVTLSPTSADAQDFANGEVSFSATGMFSKPPSPQPLTSKDVTWCVGSSAGFCAGNISPGATVDPNGVAKCAPNFSGVATILAGEATPVMSPDTGPKMTVFGTAQLKCP